MCTLVLASTILLKMSFVTHKCTVLYVIVISLVPVMFLRERGNRVGKSVTVSGKCSEIFIGQQFNQSGYAMASPRHILRMADDMGDEMLSAIEDSNIPPFFADYPQYTILGSYDTDDNEEEDNLEAGEVFRDAHGAHHKWGSNDIDLVLRRERNKEHAKRSRVRKKLLLDSLQQRANAVENENTKLMEAIREHLPNEAEAIIASCTGSERSVLASNSNYASQTLDVPDYRLIKALETAEHIFVVTDPALPDNPIVYASQGFLNLTHYELGLVLGRNARFLQGPGTDQKTVDKVRQGIAQMEDIMVVILHYRADGSTFWNQMFISPLWDGEGEAVNYLGVQCKVSKQYATAFLQQDASEEG